MPDDRRFEERGVDIGIGRVRCVIGGTGEPLVVLHRAGGLTRTPAHEVLADAFRVILIEMPGFGTSDIVDASASVREYAQHVYEAIAGVAGKPFGLVGSSFGGRVASWIAVDHQADVSALALLAPAVFLPPGFEVRTSDPAKPLVLHAHPERQEPRQIDPALIGKQLGLVARLLSPSDADLEVELANLAIPVLVAFGTEDAVLPASLGRRYVELNSRFYLSFVYDAGHAIDEDRPEAVASILRNFFEHPADHHLCRAESLISP